MKTPSQIVFEKFSELIERVEVDRANRDIVRDLTRAERAIWLTVSILHETEMDGFDSVFDQLLARSELAEAISCLSELGLLEAAELFARILFLFDTNGFYGADRTPQVMVWELPEHVVSEIDALGEYILESNVLVGIDDRLYAMLERE